MCVTDRATPARAVSGPTLFPYRRYAAAGGGLALCLFLLSGCSGGSSGECYCATVDLLSGVCGRGVRGAATTRRIEERALATATRATTALPLIFLSSYLHKRPHK